MYANCHDAYECGQRDTEKRIVEWLRHMGSVYDDQSDTFRDSGAMAASHMASRQADSFLSVADAIERGEHREDG